MEPAVIGAAQKSGRVFGRALCDRIWCFASMAFDRRLSCQRRAADHRLLPESTRPGGADPAKPVLIGSRSTRRMHRD